MMIANCTSEVLDAILDYPSYFQLKNTFLDTQGKFSSVASVLIKSQQKYKKGLFQTGSFVENHDQPRLASMTKDTAVSFLTIPQFLDLTVVPCSLYVTL